MNLSYINYCQYLLNYHTHYTITNLENNPENVSYDMINYYLKIEKIDDHDL